MRRIPFPTSVNDRLAETFSKTRLPICTIVRVRQLHYKKPGFFYLYPHSYIDNSRLWLVINTLQRKTSIENCAPELRQPIVI